MNKGKRLGLGDAMTELIRVTSEADNLYNRLHMPDAVYPSDSFDKEKILVKALNNLMLEVESDVGRRGE
jgi:hypothetical protein